MIDILTNIFLLDPAINIPPILFILKLIICGINGIIFMYAISFYSNYSWLRNKFHVFVGFALPLLALAITTIIGNNIALSLGMIGALSIIRFRTPVRTSFELIIYFCLLTFGVVASVDLGTSLVVSILLLSFILIFSFFLKIKNFFKLQNIFSLKFLSTENFILQFSGEIIQNKFSEFYSKYNVKNFSVESIIDDNIKFDSVIVFSNKFELESFLITNKEHIQRYEIITDENN